MTPSDLVALVARLKDDADYLQQWIDDGLETDFTMDPDGMRNQQKHFRDCATAIEQLRAELDVATMALKLKPRPYADADLLIEERDAARAELARLRSLEEVAEADSLARAIAASEANCDALRAELEAVKWKIDELFPVIAHGDDKHRAWLKDAIEKHFDAARAQAGGK